MADHGQGLMMRQRRCTLRARRYEGCPARPHPPVSRRRAESSGAPVARRRCYMGRSGGTADPWPWRKL